MDREAPRSSIARQAAAADEIVTIRTWIHVLRADTTVAGGNVPRAWIDDQIDVLNASFSGETGGNDWGSGSSLRDGPRTRTGSTCTARARTGR